MWALSNAYRVGLRADNLSSAASARLIWVAGPQAQAGSGTKKIAANTNPRVAITSIEFNIPHKASEAGRKNQG